MITTGFKSSCCIGSWHFGAQVAVGMHHAAAVASRKGAGRGDEGRRCRLLMWGQGRAGQLGSDTTRDQTMPQASRSERFGAMVLAVLWVAGAVLGFGVPLVGDMGGWCACTQQCGAPPALKAGFEGSSRHARSHTYPITSAQSTQNPLCPLIAQPVCTHHPKFLQHGRPLPRTPYDS